MCITNKPFVVGKETNNTFFSVKKLSPYDASHIAIEEHIITLHLKKGLTSCLPNNNLLG